MREIIAETLSKELKVSSSELINVLEVPPKLELGDYAFPCFNLSKTLRKAPGIIAQELTLNLSKNLPKEIERIVVNGPYLNFFMNRKFLSEILLKDIKKKDFGSNNLGKGKSFGIEFSQPNTHKAFHVGHIRGTSLGESIARIAQFSGNKITRINYSGDTGMHIAKWIWCYNKYHKNEKLTDEESWIAGIYVDAVKRLDEDDKLQEEVDEINRKIESREDKAINDLWKKTRKLSIDSWGVIYKQLNTKFDKHYFESEMEKEAKDISNELLKKGIAKKDDAVFMDLKEYGLGVWVLLRKDGTVLYSAKDLALALKKDKEFNLDRYLVTVGDEQQLHFRQIVKTLELMKFKKASTYGFLTFGMVRFPEGKMSSRTGKNIIYSDFFKEVKDLAKEGIIKRGYDGKDVDSRAEKIAIAAMKYSMLKQDPIKSIIFDPNEAVSFEGDTGLYLLYSYARANSIVNKVKSNKKVVIEAVNDYEYALVKKIKDFSEVVLRAYSNLSPNLIANYSFELCKLFNEFYHNCPVMGSSEEGFRLKLVNAFKITLKKALDLLGIDCLDEV